MRTISLTTAICIFITACSPDKITVKQVDELLGKKFPRIVDLYVYCGDPEFANKLEAAGLDTEGYVSVKMKKKFGDNSGWVTFNEKSSPYLLETSEADTKALVQRVKAGEEGLSEIISIEQDDENGTAQVTYTTKVKEVTPFGKLIKLKDGETKQRKALIVKNGDEWRIKDETAK